MKSYSDLPQEVLLIIFGAKRLEPKRQLLQQIFDPQKADPTRNFGDCEEEHVLKKQDLSQCTTVCRNWSDAARQVQFGHLDLTSNTKNEILAIAHVPSFGNYVKSLKLSFPGEEFADCIHILIEVFPGVERLYWDNDGDLFYSTLSTGVALKWKLRHLQTPLEENSQLKLYTTTALLYKETLQNLYLADSVGPIYDPDKEAEEEIDKQNYNNLLSKLDEFSKTRELTIKTHTYHDIEAFNHAFDKCPPSLEALDIAIYTDLYDYPVKSTKKVDLSNVKQRPHVKMVDGCLFIDNDNSLLYLMHTLCGLQHLAINHNNRNDLQLDQDLLNVLWGNVSTITVETFTQFMAYKMSIPSGEVVLNLRPSVMKDAIANYSRQQDSDKLWKLTITYDNFWDSGRIHDPRDVEQRQTSLLTVYPLQDYQLAIDYEYQPRSNHLPHMDFMQTMGSFIKDLTYVQRITREEMGRSADEILNGYYLDHIFQHCEQLVRLKLNLSTLVHLDPTTPAINHSIVDLDLTSCIIYDGVLDGISMRLPSLKYLSLSSCTFLKHQDGTWDSSKPIYINMPSTSFTRTSIQQQYSDRNHRSEYGSQIIVKEMFIKLTTTANDHTTYYKLTLDDQLEKYTTRKSEEDAYDGAMHTDTTQFKLHIACKSIDNIDLSLRNLMFERMGSINVLS